MVSPTVDRMSLAADTRRETSRHRSTARSRRRRRRALRVGGGVVLLFVAAVGWVGVRGMLAKQALDAAVPYAHAAQEAMLDGDAEAATRNAEQFAHHAEHAASLTSDPVWRAAEAVPFAGSNIESMRVIAASVDRVASGAAAPLARISAELDLARFSPSGAHIDLAPLLAAQEPVHQAAVAVSQARSMMSEERVGSADLIGPLGAARDELTAMLAETHDAIDALDRAVRLAPVMLGADGPRDTLLLFQNNAELRSTGGIAGALALLRTEGGAFALTRQATTLDFPKFTTPVVELPLETRALYGENTASYVQDVNFTPRFPLAALIAREMWKQEFGEEVDSVIALDPIVLSHLLVATGPIALPSGDVLSNENTVQLLLRDVYARYPDPREQDAFFAAASTAVVDALSGDNVDPVALIEALVKSSAERRIFIWNAEASEQAVLSGTSLAGELPQSTPEAEKFGVYLNDMTGGKMDVYLDVVIETGAVTCREDARANYIVEVTLTNTAPADAASALPRYVTANGVFGTPPGSITTSVHVYSAPGNFNLGVRRNGEQTPYHPTSDFGYTLSKVVSRLSPGQAETFTFAFLGGKPGERVPVVESTPSINATETSLLPTSCEYAVW